MPTIKGVDVADYVRSVVRKFTMDRDRRLRDERAQIDKEMIDRGLFKSWEYWQRLGMALGPAGEQIIDRAFASLVDDTRELSLAENSEFWPTAAETLISELLNWVRGHSAALELRARTSGVEFGLELWLSQINIGWKHQIQSRAHEEVMRRRLRHQEQHSDDAHWMQVALEEAKKCVAEAGTDPRPKVACVAVRDGQELGRAYRGELQPGDHAEFTLLEKKLKNVDLVGATLYVTLEPCTARSPEKTPCANRVVQRKLKRVVIAALDPNRKILGQGILTLQDAGIEVVLAGKAEMDVASDLNREFIQFHRRLDKEMPKKKRRAAKQVGTHKRTTGRVKNPRR